MSTYQELKGLKVKYLSSDTSGDRIKEGEVFYNSTDFKLRSFVAWRSLTISSIASSDKRPLRAFFTSFIQSAMLTRYTPCRSICRL